MTARRRPVPGPLERQAHEALVDSARALAGIPANAAAVAEAADAVIGCLEAGGTVFFCGNGGSAADAQHFAAELAGRYRMDRPSLPAVALTTNASSLTAIGNDYGFEHVFSRQLESLGTPGDVLIAISTSGRSANIQRAVSTAHALGMTVIGFTGQPGRSFAVQCDVALITPHAETPRIQEGHLAMGHALCELVERGMFSSGRGSSAMRRSVLARRRRGSASARSTPRRRAR
jgi:D-sedoheptulose 7-phosphate isomerase